MSLNIQIHTESLTLIREFPSNADQFVLLVDGVEITIWNKPQLRDAILPAIDIDPKYKCYTSQGALTNYAAAQYYKTLILKEKTEPVAAIAAIGYEEDLKKLGSLDDEPYEVVQCPGDCPCRTEAPIENDLPYDSWEEDHSEPDTTFAVSIWEEPPESSNDDPRTSRGEMTEEEWDMRERGYLNPRYYR